MFATSDCNQDECDLYTLHSNAEPLNFKKEGSWAYSAQLSSLRRCEQASSNDQRESRRTPDPVFHCNIVKPNAAPIAVFTEQ